MTPAALRWERRIKVAVLTLALLAILVYGVRAYASGTRCETRGCYVAALRWNVKERHRLERRLAVRTNRDASYAVRLAAAAFHIPERKLRCIAIRESGLGTQRTPEPSSGASGIAQFLPSTWRSTPFYAAGFSIWDDVANMLAAAQIISHDGSARQWTTGKGCGL